MKMPEATAAATAALEKLIAGHPELERKQMFGQPVAFVHGHMCVGVFGDRLFLRLSEEDRAVIGGTQGAVPFEPMKGRPMKEYVEMPAGMLNEPKEAARWFARSLAYAGGLSPKMPKGRRAGKRAPPRTM